MISAPMINATATTSSLDKIAVDRHCVIRCGDSWFAFPATAVREITYAPHLSSVLGSHPLLAGICHLRSEFLPVIQINLLLTDGACMAPNDQKLNDQKLLVLGNGGGNWGVLVSEVAALVALETLTNSDLNVDDPVNSVVRGTAMFQDEVVRVLDANRLQQLAQLQLERHWQVLNTQSDSSGIQ